MTAVMMSVSVNAAEPTLLKDIGVYLARTDVSATTVETIALLYPASSVGSSIAGNIKFVAGKSSLFCGIYSYSRGEDISTGESGTRIAVIMHLLTECVSPARVATSLANRGENPNKSR